VRLASALLTAQTESEAAFGSAEVYIEKYIPKPRHVEFQIFGDKYGHVVYLGERDCTIQRRHQKLIEESPSPAVDPKLRKRMGEMAVRAAKAVSYQNAGTIEFLLDDKGDFFFMEMNTRIQVEHPVTEMVTGIDLVKEQIKVASGDRLSFNQDNVRLSGYAIECRINAEDPDNDFRPCPGKISFYQPPGGFGVRIDTHIYTGYEIPSHYDSLLAKLITHGHTRQEAIRTMQRALDELIIEPIKTTIPFHKDVMRNPSFLRGQYNTEFVNILYGEGS
jgi:acetyl-CoA carboxylase biotin carboxylase subunit